MPPICEDEGTDSHISTEWQLSEAETAASSAAGLSGTSVMSTEHIQTLAKPITSASDTDLTLSLAKLALGESSASHRRERLLNTLPFASMGKCLTAIRSARPTCKWFLQLPGYLKWLHPQSHSEHHGILWVRGKPGSGKSTYMKFLYEQMQETQHLPNNFSVYFFFNAGGKELEKSAWGMYRSLLSQLLVGYTDLQQVLNEFEAMSGSPLECPNVKAIASLFYNAVSGLGHRSLTCFIDALDACETQAAIKIVKELEDLADHCSIKGLNLRICFSTRHYPHFNTKRGLQITLEDQQDHFNAMNNYIQTHLLVSGTPSSMELGSQIRARASGMFLWVVLAMDTLKRSGGNDGLDKLSKKLKDFIADIFRRDDENMEQFFHSVLWVLCARRKFRPDEYFHAVWSGLLLKIPQPKIPDLTTPNASERISTFVTKTSKGIVEISTEDRPIIQFIHRSVADYLDREKGLCTQWPEFGPYWRDFGNEILKQICHKYLNHPSITATITDLSSSTRPSRLSDVVKRYPFLKYASQNILYHANAAANSIPQDEFLREFSLSSWVTLVNLFEKSADHRYPQNASLSYILAHRGHAALVHTRLRSGDDLSVTSKEVFRDPLLDSLANRQKGGAVALPRLPLNLHGTYKASESSSHQKSRMYKKRIAISWAAENNQKEMLSLLMERGIYVDEVDGEGRTALSRALEHGHHAITKLLIDGGANIDFCDKIGRTSLFWAAKGGDEAIVEFLLRCGAKASCVDRSGKTPLFCAAVHGSEAIGKLLIDRGVDVNLREKMGRTPIFWAAKHGHKEFIKLLLRYGAEVNCFENNGQSPLFWAAKNGHTAVAKLLINKGIDPNFSDHTGRTPLFWAAKYGQEDFVKILLRHGADVKYIDSSGRTPLFWAARHGYKDIVRIFINNGAKVNCIDYDGQSPLFWAARHGHEHTARLLLQCGADVNCVDYSGQIPLSWATKHGHNATIRLLISRGSNLNWVDRNGLTSLHWVSANLQKATEGHHHEHKKIQPMNTNPGKDSEDAFTYSATTITSNQTISKEEDISQPTQGLMEEDFDDAQTEYLTESSDTHTRPQTFIAELAMCLFNEIRSLETDTETQIRVAEILPELLRAFSLRVGYSSAKTTPSQKHRELMVLVHKHRNEIAGTFASTILNQEQSKKTIGPDPELVNWEMAGERIYSQSDIPMNTDPQSYGEKESQHKLETNSKLCNSNDTISKAQSTEGVFAGDSEVKDEAWLEWQEFILNDDSFKWFISKLKREFEFSSTKPYTIQTIGNKIMSSLHSPRRMSKYLSSPNYIAHFELDWDIYEFFETQDYMKSPAEALEGIITITGTQSDAQAVTCAQYLHQIWPLTGLIILQLVKDVVLSQGKHTCQLPDGTLLEAWIWDCKFIVEATGTTASLSETAEQIGWLGAALRTSPQNKGLVYCTPVIIDITQEPLSQSKVRHLRASIICNFGFILEEIPEVHPKTNGKCWHDIFNNPVIVRGYPIPSRFDQDTGLEIPLNIMSGLIRSHRVDFFDKKVFIKGFSTILIPVQQINDIIYWHLIYKQDGSRISYLDNYISQEEHISGLSLENFRHVLGWCSEAQFYGASSRANYSVTHSQLGRPSPKCALFNTSVSSGRTIVGGSSFDIGLKDTPIHVSRSGHITQLQWIVTKCVLLWDERDKRGWLINGASALLHLVRASLKHESKGLFRSVFLFNDEALQESGAPFTAKSAIDVLINDMNRDIKLYKEDDGYILLKDRISHFYNILEKLIDHQTYIAGAYGKGLSHIPRSYLEGWDFEELAKKRDPLHPYVATIEQQGKGWIDFTRSIQAVALIGRGFGDIIQPAQRDICGQWSKLPTQKYYIASCISDLRDMIQEHSFPDDGHIRLSETMIWHTPTTIFGPCLCKDALHNGRCEPVQTLFPSALSASLQPSRHAVPEEDSGALIFGHNSTFPWIWEDTGHPREESLKADMLPSKAIGDGQRFADRGVELSPVSETHIPTPPLSITSSRLTNSPKDLEVGSSTGQSSPSIDGNTLPLEHYTVGIICALPKELAAVLTLFDTKHAPPKGLEDNNDNNHYKFGIMAQHNVVAATLPVGEYGTNSAASVATNMTRSFPTLSFCLLVGIGGGAPTPKNDIRLGDVVVGVPQKSFPSVIQYDLGKQKGQDGFETAGTLCGPSRFLCSTIGNLMANNSHTSDLLSQQLDKISAHNNMAQYRYPYHELDVLFENGMKICKNCRSKNKPCPDKGRHVRKRVARETQQPMIHYGRIASGNSVVKDSAFRDRIACKYDVLCFEMEAAGIMNQMDCVVIRGICDYCDQHKNDAWQEYAAAVAAAYAKVLLGAVQKKKIPMHIHTERFRQVTQPSLGLKHRQADHDEEPSSHLVKRRKPEQ